MILELLIVLCLFFVFCHVLQELAFSEARFVEQVEELRRKEEEEEKRRRKKRTFTLKRSFDFRVNLEN